MLVHQRVTSYNPGTIWAPYRVGCHDQWSQSSSGRVLDPCRTIMPATCRWLGRINKLGGAGCAPAICRWYYTDYTWICCYPQHAHRNDSMTLKVFFDQSKCPRTNQKKQFRTREATEILFLEFIRGSSTIQFWYLSFTHPQNAWIPPQDVDLEFSHDFALDLSGRMSIQRPAAQHWRGVIALGWFSTSAIQWLGGS